MNPYDDEMSWSAPYRKKNWCKRPFSDFSSCNYYIQVLNEWANLSTKDASRRWKAQYQAQKPREVQVLKCQAGFSSSLMLTSRRNHFNFTITSDLFHNIPTFQWTERFSFYFFPKIQWTSKKYFGKAKGRVTSKALLHWCSISSLQVTDHLGL